MSKYREFNIPSENVSGLSELIKEMQDIDINLCYQCNKCTSGCPFSDLMDYTPAQLLQLLRLGLKEEALNSNSYWFCVSCGACSARCPNDINLMKVMDALANIALREGIRPKCPDIAAFWKVGLSNIRTFGVMYELGIMAILKLKVGKLFQDLGMGLKMFLQGKFDLLPKFRNSKSMRRIFKRVQDFEQG